MSSQETVDQYTTVHAVRRSVANRTKDIILFPNTSRTTKRLRRVWGLDARSCIVLSLIEFRSSCHLGRDSSWAYSPHTYYVHNLARSSNFLVPMKAILLEFINLNFELLVSSLALDLEIVKFFLTFDLEVVEIFLVLEFQLTELVGKRLWGHSLGKVHSGCLRAPGHGRP